jgi:hypothetical protein
MFDFECLILNVEFLIGERIAHAKAAKDVRNSKCENVGKCECRNVVLWLEV